MSEGKQYIEVTDEIRAAVEVFCELVSRLEGANIMETIAIHTAQKLAALELANLVIAAIEAEGEKEDGT